MTTKFDAGEEGEGMARQRAGKYFQAQGERNEDDSDRYNGKLMRTDAHFSRLALAYFKVPVDDRASFVDRALAGEVTP